MFAHGSLLQHFVLLHSALPKWVRECQLQTGLVKQACIYRLVLAFDTPLVFTGVCFKTNRGAGNLALVGPCNRFTVCASHHASVSELHLLTDCISAVARPAPATAPAPASGRADTPRRAAVRAPITVGVHVVAALGAVLSELVCFSDDTSPRITIAPSSNESHGWTTGVFLNPSRQVLSRKPSRK